MKLSIFSRLLFLFPAALLVFTVSCANKQAADQRDRTDEIADVRHSVVSLTLRYKDGKKVDGPVYGTGFFVGEKYVATTLHVNRDLAAGKKEISETQIQIAIHKTLYETGKEFTVPVSLVAQDEENDIAVYSFDPEDVKKQLPDFVIKSLPLGETLPNIGDDILLTGYFNRYSQPFSSIGTVSMITENKFQIGDLTFNQAIFSDLTAVPGHSGGPLYSLQTHKVIGITTRIITPNNDSVRITIATNSLHLRKLLEELAQKDADNSNKKQN